MISHRAVHPKGGKPKRGPGLDKEMRSILTTAEAAYYLNRAPQTLRLWAMKGGSGPIQPVRVNGRLGWPVKELKKLLGVE